MAGVMDMGGTRCTGVCLISPRECGLDLRRTKSRTCGAILREGACNLFHFWATEGMNRTTAVVTRPSQPPLALTTP